MAYFGKSLKELPQDEIPFVVKLIIEHISKTSLEIEGIFRIPGQQSVIKELKAELDNGKDIDFEKVEDKYAIASLLKLYLRELPEPLCGFEYYDMFLAAQAINVEITRNVMLRKVIDFLPPLNKILLKYLCKFLTEVEKNSAKNKMNAENLAVVFSPNLLRPREQSAKIFMEDAPVSKLLMKTFIQNFSYIFEDQEMIPPPDDKN
ncbi:rho gtpase-activating protein 68f [Anaeramoeba ignava]|uniref:Rho gtpase-activating protein 68f n=1 Tax=Anaeramoeba ignava TaxID=1746090 RepID=A0A9Q0LHK3_ANAIG|nr:rho gtpase-activating protein 68f [Anaeramoeba ignava]|eukprot:Anaeramoba_ignava/a608479_43.p1 GENE.a608479_43~~a608479_43.p1  ORF type:complete len:205 (-),score=52.46 a608479_43:148-762(-)